MSTPLDTEPDTFTTADYAKMASSGDWPAGSVPAAAPNAQSSATPQAKPASTATGEVPPQAKRKEAKAKPAEQDEQRSAALLDATRWTPRDFATMEPAVLQEVLRAHRVRCHSFDGALIRTGYMFFFAAPASLIGVKLNVLSWATAKLSAVLVDPKNATAPATLRETVDKHVARGKKISSTAGKVGYAVYVGLTTPAVVVLNGVSWFAAHAAVAVNDPRRLARIVLGLMYLAVVIVGILTVRNLVVS